MDRLHFIPVGGLANRMRAVSSAVTLCKNTKNKINIIWFQDWALHAPFKSLFQPIESDFITLKDASFIDHLCYDRPRKKNLGIPFLFQKSVFKSCIYEKEVYYLCKDKFNFEHWIKQGNVYMASYSQFQDYSFRLLKDLFKPQYELQKSINLNCQQFTDHTIGVHIRRTDNQASIEQSPLNLFYDKIDKEIEQHIDTSIFLATDSEEVKLLLQKRYGKRLYFMTERADRSSITGIQGGIIDMYTLAKTNKIYGSFQSSFSELASQLGDTPLEIIKKG